MERDDYNEFWKRSTAAERAEYLKLILPDLEHLDVEEVLMQQESAYEYYMKSNFGGQEWEYGESSYNIENDFVEYSDEALARAMMMMEIDDHHAPPTSLDNTRSDVREPPIAVRAGQSPQHDEIDPDRMSYEQLQSLGDAVGHENKGLSKELISLLPTSKYKVRSSNKKEKQQCVICCVELKKGAMVTTLPCVHCYHSDCIAKWLEIKKHCPVCQMEVKD